MVGKTCFHLQEGSSSERERHLCSPISSCNEPEMNYINDVTVLGMAGVNDFVTRVQKLGSKKYDRLDKFEERK